MRATARPLLGAGARVQIAAAAPVRIGHHRLPADLVEGDVLGRMAGGRRDRQRREDPLGIARRPLQHLHAAHRAADDREQRVDAEMVDQPRLGAHHVADGDHRQIEPLGLAGRRVGRGRAGGAHAAAEHIGADDEEAVGVDRPARADHGLHQPGLPVTGWGLATCWSPVSAWQIRMALERVGVQRAVGLVGDLPGREHRAGDRA